MATGNKPTREQMLDVVADDLSGIFDRDVLFDLAGIPEDKWDQYSEWDLSDLREEAADYYSKHPRKLAGYYWYIVEQSDYAPKSKPKKIVVSRKTRKSKSSKGAVSGGMQGIGR